MTPDAVHHGRAPQILVARQTALSAAYAAHPERFIRKPPVAAKLPESVWINPPVGKKSLQDAPGTTIATPVDPNYLPISEKHGVARTSQFAALTPQNEPLLEVAVLH